MLPILLTALQLAASAPAGCVDPATPATATGSSSRTRRPRTWRALAELVAGRFGEGWEFLDLPTGT